MSPEEFDKAEEDVMKRPWPLYSWMSLNSANLKNQRVLLVLAALVNNFGLKPYMQMKPMTFLFICRIWMLLLPAVFPFAGFGLIAHAK